MIIENTCIPKPLQLFSKLTLLTGLMLRLIMRSCPTVLPTYWHSPPLFCQNLLPSICGNCSLPTEGCCPDYMVVELLLWLFHPR